MRKNEQLETILWILRAYRSGRWIRDNNRQSVAKQIGSLL